jgi:hypothetical protein
VNGAQAYKDCKSQAFVSDAVANKDTKFLVENFNGTDPTTQTFKSAFDTWAAALPAGSPTWTLVDGGAIDKLKLTVYDFTATAQNTLGGIGSLWISLTTEAGYAGPSLDKIAWSQGLYINYQPGGPNGIKNTMDTYSFSGGGNGGSGSFGKAAEPLTAPANSNMVVIDIPPSAIDMSKTPPEYTAWADPIYPFQLADDKFFDAPKGRWNAASFRGIALLSTVSLTTDDKGKVTAGKLTVYQGINYGFDLSATAVPEPGSWAMLVMGFIGMGAAMRAKPRRVPGLALAA